MFPMEERHVTGSIQAVSEKTETRSPAAARITEQLTDQIGTHKYDMWFANTELRVNGRQVEVATDSDFVAKWIDDHFSHELKGAARQTLGEEAEITVRVAPDLRGRTDRDDPRRQEAAPDGTGHPGRVSTSPHPETFDSHRPRGGSANRNRSSFRRLEDFVVGSCNRLAYTAACRLAQERSALGLSPMFVHGGCGLGKTHLLQGVCRRHIELTGDTQGVRYVTGEQFTNEYIAAVRDDKIERFRRRMRRLDLLAIDDVHFLANKVRTQNEFLHTIDEIGLTGSRIILASDEHPRHIKRLSQALVSRFLSGMVVQIEPPHRQTRIELAHRLAAARGLKVNDAAAEMIASHCVTSVRELEGAVTKLSALAAIARSTSSAASAPLFNGPAADSGAGGLQEIGTAMTQQLFRDRSSGTAGPIRLAIIVDVVCQRLNVQKTDLTGSSRHRRVVLARGLVAHLARELTTHSYPEIAQALGRTHHSTIHTAARRLRRQLEEDYMVTLPGTDSPIEIKEVVDQLIGAIRQAALTQPQC